MIKKSIFFMVLCVVLVNCAHTMEHNEETSYKQWISGALTNFITSWFLGGETSYVIADSQRIQDLRNTVCEVEEKLEFSRRNDVVLSQQFAMYAYLNGLEVDGHRYFQAKLRPFILQVGLRPKVFLRYCYYQQYHNKEDEDDFEQLLSADKDCFEQLSIYPALLAQCQKEQIEGCSALGAALLAKKVTSFKRCIFMQKLKQAGFDFTPKDRLLLALYLYDNILMSEKQSMILVLQSADYIGHLSMLPYDVRKYIVQCMIGVFKEKVLPFLNV